MIYTVSKLQREFGLPFHIAETILREQMALAERHYHRWHILLWFGFAVGIACNFTPDDSPYFHANHFIWPIACVYLGILQFLTWRHAQPLIRAAARAAVKPG